MRTASRTLVVGATGMLLLAIGSSFGPTIADAQAAPTLKVEPTSGGVGTTVQIAGRGFCGSPACSSVQVSFAGIVVADGIGVGTDSGFALSVPVPGGIPPGEKAVAATQTNASGQRRVAITTFQVTLGGATASDTSTATPTATGSPTTPTSLATTVILSPAAGGSGTSTGLTLAMVVAAGVFLAALLGMAYVLWRSREIPALPPSPVGPIDRHEDMAAPMPHGRTEGEPPVPGPEPPVSGPEPPAPSEGSGEGQSAG